MINSTYTLLYVKNPAKSRDFYADLFGLKLLEDSPTFVLFKLTENQKLGLWIIEGVEPATNVTGGGTELCIPVDNKTAVNDLYTDWQQRGLIFSQQPTTMDFGYTFVALDPDGHRLRIFAANS